jgi:3-methyl-2-oxobutanoate hydroxymethyltransferase
MFRGLRPKFVKRYAEIGDAIVDATRRYVEEVRTGGFPKEEHSFGVKAITAVGAKRTA